MNLLSPQATIDRIQGIETEVAMLRAEAYARAGIPIPARMRQIARLVELASIATGVSEAAIIGASRARKHCRPRFAVMWVATEAFGLSSVVIGREIGRRDHTTVLGALKRAEEWRDADDEFCALTEGLLAIVTPKTTAKEAIDAPTCH